MSERYDVEARLKEIESEWTYFSYRDAMQVNTSEPVNKLQAELRLVAERLNRAEDELQAADGRIANLKTIIKSGHGTYRKRSNRRD